MPSNDLTGRTILIVEDDFLIATDLVGQVLATGSGVMGPVASMALALRLLDSWPAPDGALLDVKLLDGTVYRVADVLLERNIPFVFTSSYGRDAIPDRYSEVPLFTKPLDLPAALGGLFRPQATG